jgi:hypothetical protein
MGKKNRGIMKIEDVPEGDWMLLNDKNEVLFHNKSCGVVTEEGQKYPMGDVCIQMKWTGIVAFEVEKVKTKAHQICSRTVEIVREETRPMINFCISAASVPAEVIERKHISNAKKKALK